VKRRICLVGSAIAAVPFVVGIGVSAAVAKAPSKGKAPKGAPATAVLNCHSLLNTVAPLGSLTVAQPPSQGSLFGLLHCPAAKFGGGVEAATFTVPDSGDTVGHYAQYFGTGSIHGTFDLTPAEVNGNLSATSFTSEAWVGTVNVTGGTGAFAKAAGTKGVLKCTSADTVHLVCTEKLDLSSL
jgi:hypothetical protein